MKAHTEYSQSKISPRKALEFLKEGNERFIKNLKVNRNLLQQVNETRDGQWPFAIILSCMDSRTSAELIFDQGLGDVFSVRIAGNIVNEDIIGSLEYAVGVVQSKLIFVLGHTKCGAVAGAAKNVQQGYITGLLQKIRPSVLKVASSVGEDNLLSLDSLNQITVDNVHQSIQQILTKSPLIKSLIDEGKVGIAGGVYDVDLGETNFIYEHINDIVHT